METSRPYLPEAFQAPPSLTPQDLREALDTGAILVATPTRCDLQRTLHFTFGTMTGRMAQEEVVAPWISGANHHMATLSRVGSPTCFCVSAITHDEKGDGVAILSRKLAQEQTLSYLEETLSPGQVLPGVVTHLAPFGTFVDIGCGIIALLPLSFGSVARVRHPSERFVPGQKIRVALHSKVGHRFTVTHKELLGTWLENASYFTPGETVRGIVRSVQSYGIFVELTPNLSGLSEPFDGVNPGDWVSVYIKSINPEKGKIKLQIIQSIPTPNLRLPLRYFITDGRINL